MKRSMRQLHAETEIQELEFVKAVSQSYSVAVASIAFAPLVSAIAHAC